MPHCVDTQEFGAGHQRTTLLDFPSLLALRNRKKDTIPGSAWLGKLDKAKATKMRMPSQCASTASHMKALALAQALPSGGFCLQTPRAAEAPRCRKDAWHLLKDSNNGAVLLLGNPDLKPGFNRTRVHFLLSGPGCSEPMPTSALR